MNRIAHRRRTAVLGLAIGLTAAPAIAQQNGPLPSQDGSPQTLLPPIAQRQSREPEQGTAGPVDRTARRASIDQPNEVLARPRPEYAPTGIRVGGFTLLPAVDLKALYDDNVYASDRYRRSDVSGTAIATANLNSNWSSNSVSVIGTVAAERFAKETTQNNETADLIVRGRYDISRGVLVTGNAEIGRLVEPRGSQGDAFIGGTPPTYGFKQLGAGVNYQPAKLTVRANAGIADYAYEDITFQNVRYSQDYRNRREASADVHLGYALSPNITGFVAGRYQDVKYENNNSGFNLNSKVTSALAGVDFTISRLVIGGIGVGYIKQNFQDPRFRNVDGLAYDGRVIWNPTPLVSVTLSGQASVQQSGIIGVGGVLQRDATLAIDYELLRNLIIHGEATTLTRDFRGIDRNDSLTSGEIGATYLIGPHLNVRAAYRHTGQGSTGFQQRDFASNRLMVTLRLQR